MVVAKLFCKTGDLVGSEFVIDRDTTIGSAPTNTIVLAVPALSPQHARMTFDEPKSSWLLEDLHGGNGTRLDNVTLKRPEKLGALHVITFADRYDFIFQIVPTRETSLPGRAARGRARERGQTSVQWDAAILPSFQPPDQFHDTAPAGNTYVAGPEQFEFPQALADGPGTPVAAANTHGAPVGLEVLSSRGRTELTAPSPVRVDGRTARWYLELQGKWPGSLTTYALPEGTHTIGRSKKCGIHVDDRTLSRRHALITVASDRVTVEDLSSANGTRIHDAPITGAVEGKSGMVLQFGDLVALLVRRP